MEIYKKDEAKLTRRVAFVSLLIVVVWGSRELGRWLTDLAAFLKKPLFLPDMNLPYYEVPFNLGVLISLVVLVAASMWLYRFLNAERMGSLLVDTETEMRKVSWPSWEDTKQSTSIVLVFVVVVAVYLTGIEVVLRRVFDYVFSF